MGDSQRRTFWTCKRILMAQRILRFLLADITMHASSKLRRIRHREERKAERERNLLSLKQSALPFFEPSARTQSVKCGNCNHSHENYGINFERLLEPIDVLKKSGKFCLGRHGATSKLLSSIMRALVVEPAQIKMLKSLQERKEKFPVAFVLNSNNLELDLCLIKFIFATFNLEPPEILSSEFAIVVALNAGRSVLISDEAQLKIVFDASSEIYWLPISVAYEIQDSVPFSFTPYRIFRKMSTGYGLIKVVFHEPYTSCDFFQRRDRNEKFVRDHLQHDIAFKAPVMATNLIALLLLTHFKKGCKIDEMSAKIDEMRKVMSAIDFAFEGAAIDIAEHSLEILQAHISIDSEGIITPKGEKIGELKEYARALLIHHALESALLSTAMYLREIDPFVDYDKMMNYAGNLSDELFGLIPFRPCASIRDQLVEAFDNLSINDLLKRHVVLYTEKEQRARKLAKYFDDDSDDYENSYDDGSESEEEELDPNNQVIINIDKQEEINVLKDIILLIRREENASGDNKI